ncbi:histone-lysine N-methyltransferase 2B [Thalassophryne amazonica]|uniref:histone-lysine N-methyltransferase 2B n=1 Tax=Thalassophryne amazonica TaxID=390379 RepID=UPI0014719912|nr:histone-lysine N-methyltransferase 2B [Thalassophryne amazonica]
MAASGGGLSCPANVVGLNFQAPARARFPGRPCQGRNRLRLEKRSRRGRLCSDDVELAAGGPRPVNIGLALSEDPSLLRLLGVTEKHTRQRDAGFESSGSEEEEEFTGFGASTVRLKKTDRSSNSSVSQSKSPEASDTSTTKPLIGKIIPKSPKPPLIGKIVPRSPKEVQSVKESPVKEKPSLKMAIKLPIKQIAIPDEARHRNEQPSGTQNSMISNNFNRTRAERANLGSVQSQTATTSAVIKKDKVVCPLTAPKSREKAFKIKEQGEVSGEDVDQAHLTRSMKGMKGFRPGPAKRTSQAVALSIASLDKQQRMRIAEEIGTSPEAGAEAGAQSGQEAAMPLECKAVDSSKKRIFRTSKRKSFFGHRRKSGKIVPSGQKNPRSRIRHVFYTYVPDSIPATQARESSELQLPGQSITPAGDEPSSCAGQVQQSANNSSPSVTSGRSSRVIKAPKRFFDEEMIPFPKGSLSAWIKNQQKEEEKQSSSFHEINYDGNSVHSDSDTISVCDSPSSVTKFSPKSNPGSSHLEIYKNLKKLTLKLAEKKKGQADTQEDQTPQDSRKRRRSKLMMEEMDSPGVVRKLAIMVNTDEGASSHMPKAETAAASSAGSKYEESTAGHSTETLEVGITSHRLGLSGANKRMLHLLKKAKVQLIKIDQQKQLKLSQLGSTETQAPVSGGRRRRRVGISPKEVHPQEQPLGGPRIKHVCRAAAVALGQPRALVPDDIPRLSALPLHEREGITLSPAVEDVADEDGEDDVADQDWTNREVPQEYIQRRRRRRRRVGHSINKIKRGPRKKASRCGICKGCSVEDDCAKCVNCLDKPKFGGPNTKRQCCIYKRCDRIEKAKLKRLFKPLKFQAKWFSDSMSTSEDANFKSGIERQSLSNVMLGERKHSLRNIAPRSYSSLLKSESDEDDEEAQSTVTPAAGACSSRNFNPQDGGLVLDDLRSETLKYRRPFFKGAFARPKAVKEQEKTKEMEPRKTFPESSSSRNPLPKLQRQLRIHLYRLPEFILQSAGSLSWQISHCLNQCTAQSQTKFSHPAAQSVSHSSHFINKSSSNSQFVTLPISQSSHSKTQSPPNSCQPVIQTAPPLKSQSTLQSPQKALLLSLQHLPTSVMQSALHLQKSVSSSPQQHPEPTLHSDVTVIQHPTQLSSKLCFQEHSESEVQRLDEFDEANKVDRDKRAHSPVQVLPQTVDPDTEMQTCAQEKQEDKRGSQPEEEEDASVKERVLRNGERTDAHFVLHSQNPADYASMNTLVGLTNGFPQKGVLQSKHKIRVDFKEDCAVQNVWLMGGLSVLSSVPTTPQPVCLLCSSKGQHEMIYCQICCEPFHSFCLSPEECPQEENKENWCCRRCKFCHVCGRKSRTTKPVLQCRRCQNSYHPSCLGPTYPKPMTCNIPWVCMTCIRCRSCGVTPGKTWDLAWNHEDDLCPDCTSLYKNGNFCTICHKCYENTSQHTQMVQCSECHHLVHSTCEGLSQELFSLLSSHPEGVVFTCSPCSQHQPAHGAWKKALESMLIARLEEVHNELMSSSVTQHLVICKRCQEVSNTEPVGEQPICDLQSLHKKFKECCYTSVSAFHADVVALMKKWLKEEEFLPQDQQLTSQAIEHYDKLMKQVFSWLPGHYLRNLNSFSEEFPSGMLPGAVLPPSQEHSYAQWLERTYHLATISGPPGGNAKSQLSSGTTYLSGARPDQSVLPHGAVTSVESTTEKDARQCALCQHYGDSAPNDEGRLLYLGQNDWAHVNCCIWSAEVYEENAALLQVHSAVSRGRHLRCDHCDQIGATVGCCLVTCQSNFHFMCARSQKCVFQQDKKMYCYDHRDLASEEIVSGNGFEVHRRTYVDFEGITLRRKFLTGIEPESINMTIGSLQIQKLGALSELSSVGRLLYPVGYQCSRLYWSTVDPRKRCKYTCKVMEVCTPLPGEDREPKWDKEKNHTIVHSPNLCREIESPEHLSISSSSIKSTTPSPNSDQHIASAAKSPSYSQIRRPAGGSSNLSPLQVNKILRENQVTWSAPAKSHHILTLRDLDDTRRPRRLSSRSCCSSSPTNGDLSTPLTRRSVHCRANLFSSPPRSSNFASTSPPLSQQNSTSPVLGSPLRYNMSTGLSPRQGSLTRSPRGRHIFKITTPVSAEVPNDFLASSEAEDVAVATSNGISLAPESLEEEVAHLMAQELPYTVFDSDTDGAVASVLNAKLDFDEALLNENVALHCGTQGGRGEVTVDAAQEQNDSREESSHYIKFTRTVVCDLASGSDSSGVPQASSAHSVSQLDGADGGSESDESESSDDNDSDDCYDQDGGGQNKTNKLFSNNSTTTKKLTVRLKRLESMYTEQGKVAFSEPEPQENSSTSAVVGAFESNTDISVQEELLNYETASQNEVILDSSTGFFIPASGKTMLCPNHDVSDYDDSSSATDSVEGYIDDLNDPDYSPESKNKRAPAPLHTTMEKSKHLVSNVQCKLPKPLLPQESKPPQFVLKVPAQPVRAVNSAPISTVTSFQGIPRTISSPAVINGLNLFMPGITADSTINVDTSNSKPGGQQQIVSTTEQAASNPTPSPSPTPQILIVNRQGHVLVKDPRSNTYQSVGTNSPPYNKISHIAKILHSSGTLEGSVPHIIIKSPLSSSATNVTQGSNHTTPSQKRVIVRVVPVKRVLQAPICVENISEAVLSHSDNSTAQDIIDRAMATHREIRNIQPTILENAQQPEVKNGDASNFQFTGHLDESSALSESTPALSEFPSSVQNEPDTSNSSRSQVRVKRVSSVSERPCRKRAKIKVLTESSAEPGDNDVRLSGVRMKAPSVKEILDLDQEKIVEKLKTVTPQPASPTRSSEVECPPAKQSKTDNGDHKLYTWISARSGDLSAWHPYLGVSSEEDTSAPKYNNRTCVNQPHLRFEITSDDGFSVKANSIEVAWRAVIDSVLEARAAFHLKQLPLAGMSGSRMLGVVHDAVIFLLEQLQGAANCKKHRFRFHRCEDIEEELPLNPTGCARAEIYTRKATFDMFNFLASQHRQLPDITGPYDEEEDDFPLKSSRRATNSELPMAMRFRHLEKASKEAVGVYRSQIHGRGLFCKRNIEAGEMVIEYAGTVIRSVLTDKREKYYDSKGIGCYMFRIDDFDVVDATMQGNAARFINHSCEPNCYSRVINVDGRKHIVIFALRKIYRGEELTYDYKFPIEDESNKLHCNCGARRCRHYLN